MRYLLGTALALMLAGGTVRAGDLLLLFDAPGSTAADAAAALLEKSGARVLRAADSAAAIAAIAAANAGPAVLVAEGTACAAARRTSVLRPELVRGVVLIGDRGAGSAGTGADATIGTPPGAVLCINCGDTSAEFGSRASSATVPAGVTPLLATRTDAVVTAVRQWLAGSALSSRMPGKRIAQPVDESRMSPEQQRLNRALQDSLHTAAGRRVGVLGPRGVLLNDPRLLQGYLGIGDAVANAPVPLRYKELAILLTARALDSDYEWFAHEQPALNAGVAPAAVAAIRADRRFRFERADDQIVYDFVSEFHRTHHVSDATYRRAWDLLGTNGLVNLTMVIAHYMGVATNLNVHGLNPPTGFTPLPPRTTP